MPEPLKEFGTSPMPCDMCAGFGIVGFLPALRSGLERRKDCLSRSIEVGVAVSLAFASLAAVVVAVFEATLIPAVISTEVSEAVEDGALCGGVDVTGVVDVEEMVELAFEIE